MDAWPRWRSARACCWRASPGAAPQCGRSSPRWRRRRSSCQSLFFASPEVSDSLGVVGLRRRTAATAEHPSRLCLVVFDEFPLHSLLDAEGRIDHVRFPHFAALAREASWFRETTTVSSQTVWAVPAIVSGAYPVAPNAVPDAALLPAEPVHAAGRPLRDVPVRTVSAVVPPGHVPPGSRGWRRRAAGAARRPDRGVAAHRLAGADDPTVAAGGGRLARVRASRGLAHRRRTARAQQPPHPVQPVSRDDGCAAGAAVFPAFAVAAHAVRIRAVGVAATTRRTTRAATKTAPASSGARAPTTPMPCTSGTCCRSASSTR